MTEPDTSTTPPKRRISGLAVFAALFLLMAIVSVRTNISTIDCNAEVLETSPDVIMLGTWWCPYCAEARRYFHANDVHYCEYDVERSVEGEKLYNQINGGPVPILIIDNKKYVGFDAIAFERLMAGRKKQ